MTYLLSPDEDTDKKAGNPFCLPDPLWETYHSIWIYFSVYLYPIQETCLPIGLHYLRSENSMHVYMHSLIRNKGKFPIYKLYQSYVKMIVR